MKRTVVNRSRTRAAFTLLEVLMVIVIIGILAAFVVPALMGTQEGAKEDMTRNAVTSGLVTPLELFRTHIGRYPTSDEGLAALVTQPDSEDVEGKWRGPYVQDIAKLKDAWGNEFVYVSPGEVNENSYDLSSPGRNGRPGDDDDITNWQKE